MLIEFAASVSRHGPSNLCVQNTVGFLLALTINECAQFVHNVHAGAEISYRCNIEMKCSDAEPRGQMLFVKGMLHRHLLILRRFTASLFDTVIAANAVNTTLSRQDPVNVVECLHTYYPAFVGWMDVV